MPLRRPKSAQRRAGSRRQEFVARASCSPRRFAHLARSGPRAARPSGRARRAESRAAPPRPLRGSGRDQGFRGGARNWWRQVVRLSHLCVGGRRPRVSQSARAEDQRTDSEHEQEPDRRECRTLIGRLQAARHALERLVAGERSRVGRSPNGVRSDLALHSVPAQSPQPTNARRARGEELKATEFDCGATCCVP
jgi:hypothetical protein